jgi:hypothetical protein
MAGPLLPYVIRQGDHLLKIAHRIGFDVDEIWNDPKNADLKALRGDGTILLPGDILYVPDPTPKSLGLSVGGPNGFSAEVPSVTVAVVFKDADGNALADEPYQLRGIVDQDGAEPADDPKTKGDGSVNLKVPVHLREVEVFFPRRNVLFRLGVGDLDPHTEESGMLQRLQNLGLLGEQTAARLLSGGGTDADKGSLEDAIKSFQEANGLEPNGEPNDDLKEKLLGAHGR